MREVTVTTPGRGRRRSARTAVVAAVVVLLWAAAPSGAQVEVPVVGIVQSLLQGPSVSIYRDCDGVDTLYAEEGAFLIDRSGDVTEPLTVPLSWTGDMVPFLDDPPATASFEAGRDSTVVTVSLATPEPGPLSLEVAVEDGPDHDPGSPRPGTAATADLGSDAPEVVWDCAFELTIDDHLAHQTIAVGEVPEPLALPFVADVTRDAPSPEQLYTEVVSGTVPPGLTYEDDTWGGAATTPGEYAFDAAVCTIPGTFIAPISVCMGRVSVTITVVDPDAAPPPAAPSAPAASPVSAAATFTG